MRSFGTHTPQLSAKRALWAVCCNQKTYFTTTLSSLSNLYQGIELNFCFRIFHCSQKLMGLKSQQLNHGLGWCFARIFCFCVEHASFLINSTAQRT